MTTIDTQRQTIRVAVIDDDVHVLRALHSLLDGAEGLTCIGACTGVEVAMQQLEQRVPDIILLDVGLPTVSGLDAISEIRGKFPRARIIMHSNYDDEAKILRARREGASGYVLKNQGMGALRSAILKVREGETIWPSGYQNAPSKGQSRPGANLRSAFSYLISKIRNAKTIFRFRR